MRQRWEQLTADLALEGHVRFSGWTDDIATHWAQCHISVSPNDEFVESFCMSAAEAMACGRATIVTNRGALPELVENGVTGVIVNAGDERALAAALCGYLAEPERLWTQGVAAAERAHAYYSLERSAHSYAALAEKLLRAASSRRWPMWRARKAVGPPC
jgi:glycosyltransferase involved in cell wall biosynthesis